MAECGLLVAPVSLAAEQAPGHLGLSGGGSWALEHRLRGCGTGWSLHGTRGLPGSGAVAQAGPCMARGVFPAQGLWRRLVLAWRAGSLGSRLALVSLCWQVESVPLSHRGSL